MKVIHFASSAEFREWLETNHIATKELWIGFWRKDSGRQGLTYSEALDEVLCYGWIDGVRRKVDDLRYTYRFTPRKSKSHWSRINIKRVQELIRQKRMAPPGLAAYEARNPSNIAKASFEQTAMALPPALEKTFRSCKGAWAYFNQQAPYYRRTTLWWVTSAKRDETQLRRLEKLMSDSTAGRRLAMFTSAPRVRPDK